MLTAVARLLLLRILPGRLFFLLSVVDAWMLWRSIRRKRAATARTAPASTRPGR
jgi:hypothetical protein